MKQLMSKIIDVEHSLMDLFPFGKVYVKYFLWKNIRKNVGKTNCWNNNSVTCPNLHMGMKVKKHLSCLIHTVTI